MNKRGLCSFDDKRYLLADGIHTLAIGHQRIPVRERVIEGEEPDGEEVITAAEARLRRIPLVKRAYVPLGRDPVEAMRSARITRARSMANFGPLQRPALALHPASANEPDDLSFLVDDSL